MEENILDGGIDLCDVPKQGAPAEQVAPVEKLPPSPSAFRAEAPECSDPVPAALLRPSVGPLATHVERPPGCVWNRVVGRSALGFQSDNQGSAPADPDVENQMPVAMHWVGGRIVCDEGHCMSFF